MEVEHYNPVKGSSKHIYPYAFSSHCETTDKTKLKDGICEYKVISKDNQTRQKKIGTSVANESGSEAPFHTTRRYRIAIDARRIRCSLWKRSHDDSVMNGA